MAGFAFLRAQQATGPGLCFLADSIAGAAPGGPGGRAMGLVSFPAVPGPGWAPGPAAAAGRESAGPGHWPTPPPPAVARTPPRRRARSPTATRSPARRAATTGARADEHPAAPRPEQSRTGPGRPSRRPLRPSAALVCQARQGGVAGPGGQGEGLEGPGEPVTGRAPDHRAVEGPVGRVQGEPGPHPGGKPAPYSVFLVQVG